MSASREFIFRGVDAVVHCGDIGADMVLTEMATIFHTLSIPVYAVLGNCDDVEDWEFYPEDIGVRVLGRFGKLELEGHRIAMLHSDDEREFEKVIDEGCYDYLLTGHSHVRHDRMENETRLINPGSAGRGMHPSCAVLNLMDGDLEFITLHRVNK